MEAGEGASSESSGLSDLVSRDRARVKGAGKARVILVGRSGPGGESGPGGAGRGGGEGARAAWAAWFGGPDGTVWVLRAG